VFEEAEFVDIASRHDILFTERTVCRSFRETTLISLYLRGDSMGIRISTGLVLGAIAFVTRCQRLICAGIRIGYYTQALSIFIANLWAPQEAPFLQNVALMFLLSILVGVSVLSRVPEQTFGIEPFMLMQVSYNTFFMGLCGQHPPDLLAWECDYIKLAITNVVALLLHGYDTWYWWAGLQRMKRTPYGEQGETLGLFIYFGQADIFGWIKYPMRAYLALAVFFLTENLVLLLFNARQQKRVDRTVSPSRLKGLAEKWLREKDPTGRIRALLPPPEGEDRGRLYLGTPVISRQHSTASRRSKASHARSASRHSCHNDDFLSPRRPSPSPHRPQACSESHEEKSKACGCDHDEKRNTLKSDVLTHRRPNAPYAPSIAVDPEPDPEPGIKRTFSDTIRVRFLGWTETETTLGSIQPKEAPYSPTFDALDSALSLMHSLNPPRRGFWQNLRMSSSFWYAVIRFFPVLVTRRFRPRATLALMRHMQLLSWTRTQNWPMIWRQAWMDARWPGLASMDIALASRIDMTLRPVKPIPKWLFAFAVWGTAGSCSLLVIGTELTIQWNFIKNVQSLTTVGQLIPMALGVGGLMKVLWSAIIEKDAGDKWCFGRCRAIARRREWEDACEVFEMCQKVDEKKRELDGEKKKEALDA
jgi:hypothetical protein